MLSAAPALGVAVNVIECATRGGKDRTDKKSERIEANQRSVQLAQRAVCAHRIHITHRDKGKKQRLEVFQKRERESEGRAERKSTGSLFARFKLIEESLMLCAFSFRHQRQ